MSHPTQRAGPAGGAASPAKSGVEGPAAPRAAGAAEAGRGREAATQEPAPEAESHTNHTAASSRKTRPNPGAPMMPFFNVTGLISVPNLELELEREPRVFDCFERSTQRPVMCHAVCGPFERGDRRIKNLGQNGDQMG